MLRTLCVSVGILMLSVRGEAAKPARGAAWQPRTPAGANETTLPRGALARLGTTRFRTEGGALGLAQDGSRIVFIGERGVIHIVSAATGLDACPPIDTHGSNLVWPVLSPDGSRVAAQVNGILTVWDLKTRESLPMQTGGGVHFESAFSRDGRSIVVSAQANRRLSIAVCDAATGKLVRKINVPTRDIWGGVAISAGATMVASWYRWIGSSFCESDGCQVWDLKTGKAIGRFTSDGGICCAAFSPDGRHIALGGNQHDVRLLELASGQETASIGPFAECAEAVGFSDDGAFLAVHNWTNGLTLWRLSTNKCVASDEAQPAGLYNFTFVGERLIGCGMRGRTIVVWEVGKGKWLNRTKGHCDNVCSIAFADNGNVLSVDTSGDFIEWTRNGDVVRQRAVKDDCKATAPRCALTTDGKRLVLQSDKQLTVFETDSFRRVGAMPFEAKEDAQPVVSSDGMLVVNGPAFESEKHVMVVWDLHAAAEVRRCKLDTFDQNGLAVSRDHRTMAASAEGPRSLWGMFADRDVVCWDTATGKEVARFTVGREGYRNFLTFCGDDGLLAVVETWSRIGLWDLSEKKRVRTFLGGVRQQITRLAASRDGKLLAVGMQDIDTAEKKIRILDVMTGTLRHEFTGQFGEVTSFTFSPDGKLLASGSADTTIILWSLTPRAGH